MVAVAVAVAVVVVVVVVVVVHVMPASCDFYTAVTAGLVLLLLWW